MSALLEPPVTARAATPAARHLRLVVVSHPETTPAERWRPARPALTIAVVAGSLASVTGAAVQLTVGHGALHAAEATLALALAPLVPTLVRRRLDRPRLEAPKR